MPDGLGGDGRPNSNSAASSTWPTNPATGQAWTLAQVNALQAGVEDVYVSAPPCTRVKAGARSAS